LTGFNIAKLETLRLFQSIDMLDSGTLSVLLGISLHTASNRLRRAYHQGLAVRWWEDGGYTYMLTEKRLDRLRYLEKQDYERLLKVLARAQKTRCKAPPRKPDPTRSLYEESEDEDGEENYITENEVDLFTRVAGERCPVERQPAEAEDDEVTRLLKAIEARRCLVGSTP
jgi:hypothetical protein